MGNIISQEARKRQAIVKYALKKGKSKAAAMYGVSLSSIKRWCKRYDGTWQSLKEKSHRPHHQPSQHTQAEEKMIYHSLSLSPKNVQKKQMKKRNKNKIKKSKVD